MEMVIVSHYVPRYSPIPIFGPNPHSTFLYNFGDNNFLN